MHVAADAKPIDAAAAAVVAAVVDAAVADAAIAPPDAAEVVVHLRIPGKLSIDSTPYATITIDGLSLGVTPILHKTVAAGRHRLHAVLKDGRTKDLVVDVPVGRAAPAIVLTW